AAKQSRWARRRKIGLADLVDAPLISPPSDTPGGATVTEAFRAAGLPAPLVTVTTFSVHLRNLLCMRDRFIAVLPVSILQFNPGLYSLKELALDLPAVQLPAVMVTLKNRTLSPPVQGYPLQFQSRASSHGRDGRNRVLSSANQDFRQAQQGQRHL